MALTAADVARMSPAAQKQITAKLVGEAQRKERKYRNEPTVSHGITFDSKKEAQFYSLSWIFWLRFAHLMRSNKNSQNNIQQLVEMFKQNDEAVIPENSEIE